MSKQTNRKEKGILDKRLSISVVPITVFGILVVGVILSVFLMPITEPSIQNTKYKQNLVESGVNIYWNDQLTKVEEEK
ncbi:hypothetical protein V7138_12985 [Bacillus sp. JJ1533]|uniref:hypothetical protein n=1 Tax=Bacillus sp. JJ1533 TaxID=3122959 RepID=UPI002FFDE975